MNSINDNRFNRRSILGGGVAGAAMLALPACATYPGFSLTEAVRRLLMISTERAFMRLTEDGGFWDEQVARVGLGQLLGTRGDVISRVLTSRLFKERLEGAMADIAIEGSYRAAPVVTEAVRVIGLANAAAIIRGGPKAATAALRGELGGELIDAMVPELGEALRIASDPLVAELINAATGSNVGSIAQNFAGNIDKAIWDQIGIEEAAIRADPGSTNDPMLRAVFGAASVL
jgi:hypothetical protein